MIKTLGIIPARYASTRFPGKPLADIGGKSMIRRVYEQACKCSLLDKVWVATDDERIAAHVTSFGGRAVMTSPKHLSGTDRCAEVLDLSDESAAVIINIQGDEPFIDPTQIDQLARCFHNPDTQIATLVKEIKSNEELFNHGIPKVVVSREDKALYFSRTPVPYLREVPVAEWHLNHTYYKHIGMYGYRSQTLRQIAKLPPGQLEQAESLEQLRWLENGYVITTAVTDIDTLSIDTPEDLLKTYKNL